MITVKYSCSECGLKRIEVQVPARDSVATDVRAWMDRTVRILCEDHQRRSPNCHPKELKELMIPCPPESEFIGQQIE